MPHDDLVLAIRDFIQGYWQDRVNTLILDHGVDGCRERPYSMNGHVPDAFARVRGDGCVVGEAKTPRDFESNRSQEQITRFLEYAHEHGCYFVLSVPFTYHRAALGRLKALLEKNEYCVDCFVIHEFGSRSLGCKS